MLILLAMSGRRLMRLMYYERTKLGKETSAMELALKVFLCVLSFSICSI